MNKTQELLVCTMEEAAELIQACSKVMRIAAERPTVDKKKLAMALINLKKETADVQAMINILVEKQLFTAKDLGELAVQKRKKLRKYSNIFK
jgi:NTP pyrophosphatase (non-canonical NTP hydrolase)